MLTRSPARPSPRSRPETALAGPAAFVHGRVHEICGPARRSLALMAAGRLSGPVLWLRPKWTGDRPCAAGISRYLNPARIVFADIRHPLDIQWSGEEALRSGAVPALVIEMPDPPGLTPVRRLQLAAETAEVPALILLLTNHDGGAQGVETRWHIAPSHTPSARQWVLTRLRARMLPPANWTLSEVPSGLELA